MATKENLNFGYHLAAGTILTLLLFRRPSSFAGLANLITFCPDETIYTGWFPREPPNLGNILK